jgi:type III pantothenate kinase
VVNLVIDIGNTRTKAGVFDAGRQAAMWVGEEEAEAELFALATNHRAENVILSTVSHGLPAALAAHFAANFRYLELDADTPLPFENRYRTPRTLGKDRLAAVAGAQALLPGMNCLVVDAGTCITLDVLSAEGVYLGGNIAPGIRMRLRAMHEHTQRLPLVEPGPVTSLLGDATETALRNGAVLGAALEVQALAGRLEREMGPVHVVLTGGDAAFLAENLENEINLQPNLQPNLVLIGLDKILSHYVE